jgi:hypothetical protein
LCVILSTSGIPESRMDPSLQFVIPMNMGIQPSFLISSLLSPETLYLASETLPRYRPITYDHL